MENTSKPLPGAGTLISDSWKLFTTTWNTSVKTSSLLIYVGLAYFVAGLLVRVNPALGLLTAVISLAGSVFTVWISIRVILTMMNLEAGKQPMASVEEGKKAWTLFWSLIWVGFLTGLVVFGASLLFILPGIYFGVALYFSQLILIDQGTRGTQALGASRALVRGRWWPTFWRLIAGGFVFGLLLAIVMGIVIGGIAMLIGSSSFSDGPSDPLVVGILQLIQMVIVAAFMPLMTGFQVKLYRALQKTR
nr:hypothetical protein [uncultured bacterium]AIA16242.1 Unknown Function [uncultured bacterium]